jgi:hypothetical protein
VLLATRVYGDLTSSNWMKDTEAALRHRTGNPDAHLLPIILYSDGVAVGAKESIVSVMGTCGLNSDYYLVGWLDNDRKDC